MIASLRLRLIEILRVLDFEYAVVFLIFFLVFASMFRGIFLDPSLATQALESQGYTQVEVIKKSWFFVSLRGCGRYDAAMFTVKAANPAKGTVVLTVCTNWPIGTTTLRID